MKKIAKAKLNPRKRERVAFNRAQRREIKRMIRRILRTALSGAAAFVLVVSLTGCSKPGKRMNSDNMQTVRNEPAAEAPGAW